MLGLGRTVRSLLYEIDPMSPGVFAMAVGILTLVSLTAGWLPARHAAYTNPMTALRDT